MEHFRQVLVICTDSSPDSRVTDHHVRNAIWPFDENFPDSGIQKAFQFRLLGSLSSVFSQIIFTLKLAESLWSSLTGSLRGSSQFWILLDSSSEMFPKIELIKRQSLEVRISDITDRHIITRNLLMVPHPRAPSRFASHHAENLNKSSTESMVKNAPEPRSD